MTQTANTAKVSPKIMPNGTGAGAAPARKQEYSFWARLLMPSITDVVFVVLLFSLSLWARQFLADPDIGWHIRNGQHILATRSIPRLDYFSYTMAGRAWYAWEWLYDVIVAGIHSVAELNGVVLFSAMLVALSFAVLFRLTLKSSSNLVVGISVTLLSVAAASVHLLARPHLFTWLFTVIWFQLLDSFQYGRRKHLFLLPALMLLWVNLHGGFLLGLALPGVFLMANLGTRFAASSAESRWNAQQRARHLSFVLLLSLAATLFTPYGYRLHVHLYEYLGNKFLMNNISEFLSPDFHTLPVKSFAILLVLAMVALALHARKASGVDLLIIAFSTWMGLYAARNVPIASILLALTVAPLLGTAVRDATDRVDISFWLRRLFSRLEGFSARMTSMEERFQGHVLAAIMMAMLVVSAIAQRDATQARVQFDPKRVPAQAAEYMAMHNIRDHFFSPDSWSGYLIYRLYPDVRVMVDDRHDFYGDAFLRACLQAARADIGWREILDVNKVNWVVIPPDYSLSSVLKLVNDWKVVYDDGTAIIFERTIPLPAK